MLQGMTMASPPAALMPSATSLQASALREETTTLAPSFASSSAEERPMPRLEPVTIATFPVRSNGVFFIVGGLPDSACPFVIARRRLLAKPGPGDMAAVSVAGLAQSVERQRCRRRRLRLAA